MDKPTIPFGPVRREQRFRAPSGIERKIGLWVDRIGEATDRSRPVPLRILGQYAAVFVKAGHGWFESRTAGRVRVRPNDVMLLFPDEPARYGSDVQWETLWIVWNGGGAARLEECGYLSPRRPVIPDGLQAVRRAHAELTPILNMEGRDAVLRRKLIVLNMVCLLSRARSQGRVCADARIGDAVQYLVEHSAAPFSLSQAAARCHLSPTHFRRLFKDYTGVGPLAFVAAQRIARAKELLGNGRSIKVAAAETGFRDVFYFMRVFKKVAGVTAGEFLKSEH